MTYQSTQIQLKSNEEVLMDIGDIILPATTGNHIVIEGYWYKIVEVNIYCRHVANSYSAAVSETILVEAMEEKK